MRKAPYNFKKHMSEAVIFMPKIQKGAENMAKKEKIKYRTLVEMPDGTRVPWEDFSKEEQDGIIERAMIRAGKNLGWNVYKNGVRIL